MIHPIVCACCRESLGIVVIPHSADRLCLSCALVWWKVSAGWIDPHGRFVGPPRTAARTNVARR